MTSRSATSLIHDLEAGVGSVISGSHNYDGLIPIPTKPSSRMPNFLL